jgi:hypothetical protein
MSFDWITAAGLPIGEGYGLVPTKGRIRALGMPFAKHMWLPSRPIHNNPRFFKHYWKIWTVDDAIPDEQLREFTKLHGRYPWLQVVPSLSFSVAIEKMHELCEQKERFMTLDLRAKRDGRDAPWDISAVQANGDLVAPCYDEDQDEPFHGHK